MSKLNWRPFWQGVDARENRGVSQAGGKLPQNVCATLAWRAIQLLCDLLSVLAKLVLTTLFSANNKIWANPITQHRLVQISSLLSFVVGV